MLIQKVKTYYGAYKGEALYLLSQYTTPVVGLLINVFAMRFIGPKTLGIHQSIILWGSYFTFIQLGVFNGLNRNLAYFKGAKKLKELNESASTGLVVATISSGISLCIVGLISLSPINTGGTTAFWAFIFLVFFTISQPFITFFDTLYRTGQDFKKIGIITLIGNAVFALGSVFLIFFNYVGYVWQNIGRFTVDTVLRAKGKYKELEFRFSLHAFKDLIHTGFPIMIVGYLYTSFFIFDQFYIVNEFSTLELGYYNLARLTLFVLPVVPTSLNTILYPKASSAYGQAGDNKEVLKQFYSKALLLNILTVVPIVLLIYFLVGPIVRWFLPDYVEGIEYAKHTALGGVGYIMIGPSVVLGVLKKHAVNLIALITISALSYGQFFLGWLDFDSIVQLIWFKNILFFIYAAGMLLYIYFLLSKRE